VNRNRVVTRKKREHGNTNFDTCSNDKELAELDKKGMPDPLSEEKLSEITSEIFQKYHEEVVTCAVCNQFTNISLAKLLSVKQFPKKMYTILKVPNVSGMSAQKLHPILVKQYDVFEIFAEQLELKNVMLSPNGVVRHITSCVDKGNCKCTPKMYFCDKTHQQVILVCKG